MTSGADAAATDAPVTTDDDPLAEGLRALRMRGALFSKAQLQAPFGVQSGDLPYGVFHAVVAGRCVLRAGGGDPIELVAGDVVYLPHGTDHLIADIEWRSPTPRSAIGTRPGEDGLDLLEVNGDGDATTLLCGRVEVDDSGVHPVVELLPDVIHVNDRTEGVGAQVPALIMLLSAELQGGRPGAAATVARLTDVLVLHMIRHHVETQAQTETGWFRAMGDPLVARSIGLIHQDPARSWTAAGLAREVGLSRSAFFARFRDLVGEGPIEYLTRWRMHVASRRLLDGQSVAAAAQAVGYATEASFSDAFLRVTGSRPGAYRTEMQSTPVGGA